MNTIARLKDCITKLKNTKLHINIVLARNLENLVISYISSKSKPFLGNDENTSKVDQESHEVRIEESTPVNLDAFLNREEGFNGWEEFEDIDGNSSTDNIDKSLTRIKTNEEVQVPKTKDFEFKRFTSTQLYDYTNKDGLERVMMTEGRVCHLHLKHQKWSFLAKTSPKGFLASKCDVGN